MILIQLLVKGKAFMTDNLLQKLEEKVVVLVSQLESLRRECGQLKRENSAFKAEQGKNAEKLRAVISLLDVLEKDNVINYTMEAETA